MGYRGNPDNIGPEIFIARRKDPRFGEDNTVSGCLVENVDPTGICPGRPLECDVEGCEVVIASGAFIWLSQERKCVQNQSSQDKYP